MFSKLTIALVITIASIAGFFAVKSVQEHKAKHYNIAIIKSVDHPALDMTADGIISESKKANIEVIYQSAQGDSALAHQIIQKFIQKKVDAIVPIGTTVTQVAAQKTKTIPIVFASVTDPIASGIVKNLDRPEANVTGVSNFAPDITAKQFEFYKKLLPNIRKIGLIYNSGESNSIAIVEKIKIEAKKNNIDIKEVVIQNTNDAILAVKSIISSVDALLVDNDNTALSAIKGIVDIAAKSNVPVFCSDTDTVALGVLAAVGPNQYKLGEKAGELLVKIVNDGAAVAEIPVAFASDLEYLVNKEVAEKLQIIIPDQARLYQ
jgi:putative ABC transport system substrate-binding protein